MKGRDAMTNGSQALDEFDDPLAQAMAAQPVRRPEAVEEGLLHRVTRDDVLEMPSAPASPPAVAAQPQRAPAAPAVTRSVPALPDNLVAVDAGHAWIKLLAGYGKSQIKLALQASAKHGISAHPGLGLGPRDREVGLYITEGSKVTVSNALAGVATDYDGYHSSPIQRCLVQHALRRGGFGGRTVDLVTGLPVGEWLNGGPSVISEKMDSLQRPVAAIDARGPDKQAVTIGEVSVVPEAMMAAVDHVMTVDLELLQTGPIGVVDIGGRTTDCVVMLEELSIDSARSGTVDAGVLNVREVLERELGAKFEFRERLSSRAYEQALRTGRVQLFGKDEDVRELVQGAVNEIGNTIFAAVRRQLGKGANLQRVLLAGGGTYLFRDGVGAFPHATLVPEPEFANARGMLKYGQYRVLQGREA
jgi:plasmid segregation protein ParM